jgi:hypothetical protein
MSLRDVAWASRELSQHGQRRRRYQLAQFRADHANDFDCPAALTCMAPSSEVVVVHVGANGTLHKSGVNRCKSVGSCPLCAPTIRSTRAADIEAAVEAWHLRGGEVWFLTLTIPHAAGDDLGDNLSQLRRMWRRMWNGKAGQALKQSMGRVGYVRAFEVTWTYDNGWHPHLHVLLFTKARRMEPRRVLGRWRSCFDAEGIGDRWVPYVSADLRKVTRRGAGAYLGKIHQEWGAGVELARSDVKRGVGLGGQQLLELASTGEVEWVDRWREWEHGTKALRWIEWSRGLRAKAGVWQLEAMVDGHELQATLLTKDEATDEEAASGPDADEVVASWHVPAPVWNRFRLAGMLGVLLGALVNNDGERYGCRRITPWLDPSWRPMALDRGPPSSEPVLVGASSM